MTKPEDSALIERELAVVDEALEAGSAAAGDAEERELRALALALAADPPQPSPEFTRELNRRVAQAFPREREKEKLAAPRPGALRPSTWLPKRLPRRLAPAMGVAAAGVVAAVVAVSLRGGDDGVGTVMKNNGQRSASAEDFNPPGPQSKLVAPAPGQPGAPTPDQPGFDPAQGERRIERSARLTLAAPASRLERVGDDVTGVADRYDGFVLSSSLSTGQDATPGGTFELRVPAADLRPALRDLARLGTVRSRSQSGEDVTVAYVSVGDQLQSSRAERRGLLRRLERAGSASQADAIRRQLDISSRRISGLQSRLKALRADTDYARVNVTLEARRGSAGAPGSTEDGIGGAWHDALGSLTASVELLVRALGVLLPLGLLATLAWAAARTVRRRRRDAALT